MSDPFAYLLQASIWNGVCWLVRIMCDGLLILLIDLLIVFIEWLNSEVRAICKRL